MSIRRSLEIIVRRRSGRALVAAMLIGATFLAACTSKPAPSGAVGELEPEPEAGPSAPNADRADAAGVDDGATPRDAAVADAAVDAPPGPPTMEVTFGIGDAEGFQASVVQKMASGMLRIAAESGSDLVVVTTKLASPGTYECLPSYEAGVTYQFPAVTWSAGTALNSGTCTVTLTAVGPVGGRVRGSFTSMLAQAGSSAFQPVHGAFDVVRTPDP